MSTSSIYTPEAIEEMRATVRAKEAKRAEVQAANDARRVAALNAASAAYNALLPLLFAEAVKGIKCKVDGSVMKKDKERIDQIIADNAPTDCRIYWKITTSGNFSLDVSKYWDQESDLGGMPNGMRAEVGGYCFLTSSVDPLGYRPLEQLEVMKTDRTAEAVAAARIEFKQVEQQIADLNHKLSSLKRVISC